MLRSKNISSRVVISFPHFYKERERHRQSHQLRADDRKPDSVDSEKIRQYQKNYGLKYQRPQKRDDSGNHTVIQRCKERGSIDVKAVDQECQTIQTKAVARHGVELRVIAHKKFCERAGKKL